jgi:hypothetical protein
MELNCSLRMTRGQADEVPDAAEFDVLVRKPKVPPGNPKMMTPLFMAFTMGYVPQAGQ